jgi:hypothetical protein
LPSLAQLPRVVHALHAVDAIARRLLPAGSWMYLVFEAMRT